MHCTVPIDPGAEDAAYNVNTPTLGVVMLKVLIIAASFDTAFTAAADPIDAHDSVTVTIEPAITSLDGVSVIVPIVTLPVAELVTLDATVDTVDIVPVGGVDTVNTIFGPLSPANDGGMNSGDPAPVRANAQLTEPAAPISDGDATNVNVNDAVPRTTIESGPATLIGRR